MKKTVSKDRGSKDRLSRVPLLKGAGTIVDLGATRGVEAIRRLTRKGSDDALRGDGLAIGADFYRVLKQAVPNER